MRRHPLNSQRRGRCQKIRGSKSFNAPNATDGEQHEKGSFHHCCRMFWHGSLNSTLLMEQGGVHVCIQNFILTKKIRETAYVSINQGHPIMEAADSKKAGNVIGGVKDDGAF